VSAFKLNIMTRAAGEPAGAVSLQFELE